MRMLFRLRENRVWRTYLGGARIDRFCAAQTGKIRFENSYFPEDWTASTIPAMNAGREGIIEGIGHVSDGRAVSELVPGGLPILVKLLDAAERLAIQVHPTREFARREMNSPVGKTESWYILDADADACVYIGFKPDVTRESWIDVFNSQDIPRMLGMLHRLSVKNGDSIFVPGGMPHAIGGGCLMVELQEPSDLIVVPERITPSGRPVAEQRIHGGLGYERMFDVFEYKSMTEEELRHAVVMKPEQLSDGCMCMMSRELTGIFSMMVLTDGCIRQDVTEPAVAIITESGSFGGEAVNKGERLLLLPGGGDITVSGGASVVLCES